MEVEFVLTEDDIVALAHRTARRSLKEGKGAIIRWIVIAFLLLMFLVHVVNDPDDAFSYYPIPLIAFVVAVHFLTPWMVVQNTKRALRQGRYDQVLGRHRLLLTPEALTHDSEYAAGRTLWAAVHRIDKTKDHAFILLSGNTSLIVPRRAFADEESFSDFVNAIRRFREEGVQAEGE